MFFSTLIYPILNCVVSKLMSLQCFKPTALVRQNYLYLKVAVILVEFFLLFPIQAQVPAFDSEYDVCLKQSVDFINQSSNAVSYEWDFCSGDLGENNLDVVQKAFSSLSVPVGTSLVKFDGNWYGFVSNINNNSITRLNFGYSLDNQDPEIVNMGNVGGMLSGPQDLKAVVENGLIYIFVSNRTNNKLIRINLGNNINNSSPTTNVLLSGAADLLNNGIDVVFDGQNWIVFYTSQQAIRILRLGSSLSGLPSAADIILSSNIPGVNAIGDISIIKQGSSWYGFVVGYTSKTLHRLSFGINLFSDPIATNITIPALSSYVPYSISLKKEASKYLGFISTSSGDLIRTDFGTDVQNSYTFTVLGKYGMFVNTFKIEIEKEGSQWKSIMTSWSANRIFLINFPNDCGTNTQTSTEESPTIVYNQFGSYQTTLTAFGLADNESVTHPINVSNKESPIVSFDFSDEECAGVEISFSSSVDHPVVTYYWNFGDDNVSSVPNPVHQYSVSGAYSPQLVVENSLGCSNYVQHVISIYNEPVANFNFPETTPICTNQMYLFENISEIDVGSSVTWEWFVNGVMRSNAEDLDLEFNQTIQQDIMLRASIPGCENSIVKSVISVFEGSVVDFTSEGQCEDNTIIFSDNSTGDITSYHWNFDDGESSDVPNPVHNFHMQGVYNVTLQTTSPNGCQNTKTKSLPIYSLPQPTFQLALPPFSCSGSPSQFTDTTPNPTDSNITSWLWQFNDSGSSDNTSTLKNPVHTYSSAGQYDVALTATTNYGCENSITKSVTIAQSPLAEILNTPACDDVPVTFTTSSQSDIKSWSWQIGVTQFTTPEPVYVFNNPGSYTVDLNAVGNNNCIASTGKNVVVPLPLVPDFTVQKNCAGQEAEFTDATVVYEDPVSKYDWNFGDAATGEDSPVRHTYVNTGPYGVMQSVTTASGCNYKNTKSINVGVSPTASFTALPEVGVPPLSVTFNNTSSNANHYFWNFNDPNNSTSTEVSPQFTFLDYGNYVVDLTAFNAQNCSHTFSKVITAALPLIDVGLENLTISENINGLLTAQLIIHNKGNVTLQNLNLKINLSGIEIQQTVNEPVPPYSSILYTLDFNIVKGGQLEYLCVEARIEGDNNSEDNTLCSSIDNKVIVMAPYPNPSPGNIHLDWVSPADQSVQISIYDPLGKMVFENGVEASEGFNDTLLNLEELTAGVYFLVFRSAGIKQTQRFVIQR